MARFRPQVNELNERPTTSWNWLIILTITLGIFGWYIAYSARGIVLNYDQIDQLANKTSLNSIQVVELPGNEKELHLPLLALLGSNKPWVYVSPNSPVPDNYQASNLVETALAHTSSDAPHQIEATANRQLEALFAHAENDGHGLMVTSAYRTVQQQQSLYDAFVEKRGAEVAENYIVKPGSSEHHTGYAVDVTNASDRCQQDVDNCVLSPATASWLAETAPDYGFIIRYPSGKKHITGIAHEPWHLRYVGKNLAVALTSSGLTFDEFIEQVAPGRAK